MKKYEKEVLQAHLDNEKEVLKKLETIYEDAIFEIDERLAVLLGRDDATLQNVIYQVDYQRALKTQIKAILEKLQANEFETVAEYLEHSYDEGFLGAMYSLQNQGIPLVIPISQEQVVAAIQHETKLKSSLYTEMGKDIGRLQKQIAGEISRGISSASTYTEIAQNIARYSKIPMNRAMTISRTESHRISETANSHAQEKAKSKGAKIKKIWDASLDAKTRDSHMRVDGEIRELDEKFSNGLMYPGEPNGDAEEVINCRCRSRSEAEWALDAEETKYLGNVKKMSDKRKEEIAEKLGVSVQDLEGYSGQIVSLKPKNYQDFKKQYKQASERVRLGVQKTKNPVVDLQEYTVNKVTYKVDGKHVILDNTKNEKEIAKIVGEELEKQVQIVPRVVFPQGVSTPDYIIGNQKFDLKEPTGSGKNVLYNMVHKKKSQANNFIFDISNCPLDDDAINKQVEGLYNSAHTAFIDEIIIVKDGKVKKKYKRGK